MILSQSWRLAFQRVNAPSLGWVSSKDGEIWLPQNKVKLTRLVPLLKWKTFPEALAIRAGEDILALRKSLSYCFLCPKWPLNSSRMSSWPPLQYVSQGLRMVAVLCAAPVVVFAWVKDLGGISLSSFSMISFILSLVSAVETSGHNGASW
ncbi:hypothetical protein P7K49_020845 [Saguinus oedipus]|uniref:Uncharacterized protein n=1 Tax=Saguinus oedipus TaxID=9490 RepID=A0ABQ9UQY3_SAGOE|nr:hypothetical protein P7K49_020845 [Saguinus oedipus]